MSIPDELRRFEAFGRDKELRFTNDYVIPVLQQLGLSVVYNHGQREYGRDLVVGELDTFSHFIYFGVQVKFEPNLGLGNASRDLANDARQAFLNPFVHPQTGRNEWVSRFYAINAGTITAFEDVYNQINDRAIASNTVLIDGNGIVGFQKLGAFTRGAMIRETLTGLLLEIRTNRDIMPIMDTSLVGDVSPQRCRLSATAAFLARPFALSTISYSQVSFYWTLCNIMNMALDELLRVPKPNRENRQQLYSNARDVIRSVQAEVEESISSVMKSLEITTPTTVPNEKPQQAA